MPRAAAVSEPLTAREQDVLVLLAQGHANPAIARSLGISRATVKVHVEHILGKLGVHSRTRAVLEAVRLGLLGVPGAAD